MNLIAAAIGMSVFVLAPAAFLAAYFLHLPIFAAAGMFLLAMCVAGFAAVQVFQIWWGLRLGRWTGWNNQPIGRHEAPARYWSRTGLHGVIVTIYATGAVFLVWFALSWMARR
ncbi:MAG TPA: hypothetical protein VGH15_07405 [Caulobacteraceae bacterium]